MIMYLIRTEIRNCAHMTSGFRFLSEGDYDFTMRIYNNDGSEPEMCGNGIRCLAQFLKDLGEDGKRYRAPISRNTIFTLICHIRIH